MKISILDDNRDFNGSIVGHNAFSLYFTLDNINYLFDLGADDTFIKNAQELNLDLEKLDYVFISHGHYDHGDGLEFIKDKKVIVGKGVFTKRFSKRRNGVSSALSYGKEIKKKHKFITIYNKKWLNNKIVVFKTNFRPLKFENNNYPTYLKNKKDDIVKDEISVAVKTEKGLVIISGCSHAGICNIILNAQKICKEEKVYAVIGGFHLTTKLDRAKLVIQKLKEIGVENCYTGHCISDECANLFLSLYPNAIILKQKLQFEIK